MDENAQLQRDVGRLEGKMDAMAAQHAAMATQNADMGLKLDRVVAYIDGEKGAKRTWSTITGSAGAIAGAVAGGLMSWWLGGKP